MVAVSSLTDQPTAAVSGSRRVRTLASLPIGRAAIVASDPPSDDTPRSAEVRARLAEIGVLEGQSVKVIAAAPFGGPLAVKIGSGTFALRRAEASVVWVYSEATDE